MRYHFGTLLVLQADAESVAILVKAQAQSEALQLIAVALAKNPNLITYEYVQKLSPNIRAMLVPNNAPFILPLPDFMTDTTEDGLPSTVTSTLTTTVAPTLTTAISTPLVPPVPSMPDTGDKKSE